ncbi:hypothetical protein NPS01_10900 [Nocardioides psychrotolerans]|uniref:Predicted NAD/FAD-binding protein n=1 Tax=Nocardioides psychrotolerans TaxID=1005945 RepID=A0A1I3ECM2_9ACTN|nr:FAD-dependent oxidoreductase [Nocardioides psychrotolerans]GEP37427.1 hypothetical protein NPS01_10900 [Nocardioides psychrotolerans]SFH96629.1 Predicted NAD/FAD-binding protein [Nocardioides psychrotolerans]
MTTAPRRVAVVGSGIAGLTAAYVAAKTAHVTLFETDDRLGGHADTHRVPETSARGVRELAIDTGFIVHNERTYPVLLRMFAELGVQTQPSEMSMSIRDDQTGLEWAGALGRKGVIPTAGHLANPRYLRMLTEIPRFHRRAKALLAAAESGAGADADTTLRVFLDEGGFTPYFTRHFMEPLVAAVWSCDPEVSLDYPARYLFSFLQHHGMLTIFGSPQWRTVTGGSHSYVDRVAAALPDIRLGAKVTSVLETPDGVEVTDGNGEVTTFDAIVIAAHPGQALTMLAEPTELQRELLSAMPYAPNTAILHTDTSLLPETANTWASWNFRRPTAGQGADGGDGVLVTYDLTRLQRLDTDVHYLVTLGGEHLIDPATVIDRMEYEHPLYNPTSVAAQARLPEIDTDRVAFAGAYHGWGFHEDGARSGLAAVERLGLTWPDQGERADRTPVPALPAGGQVYETTISHTRRAPFVRSFEHASHTWLVDLDALPDHGILGRFEARDHLGSPERSLRANIEDFLAEHGVTLGGNGGGGRILMAANARAFGYCFNPISVFWCWDSQGERVATVVEVHNTYGDRHAYLVQPDANGRATTDKAMYVSPFHGTDGRYDLAVPVPGRSLAIAVTLHSDDGAVFSAALKGRRSNRPAWRAAPAVLRHSALIRAHGIWLWLRRLPIRPRPHHHQEGVSR